MPKNQSRDDTQSPPGRNPIIALAFVLTALGAAIWLGGIFWAPYLAARGSPLENLVYLAYSSVCHQLPARSFTIFNQPMAVCCRCFGIYSGFLVGVAAYPLIRGFHRLSLPPVKAFGLISAPIVLDTAGNFLGLWESPNVLRFGTGLLWGAILPLYFISGLADLLMRRRLKPRQQQPF
jgi:uncharacterized membrane protein